MNNKENIEKLLKIKFKNCLLGCLVGDCLGSEFENDWNPCLKNFLYQLEHNKNMKFNYTDDTALTIAVCYSLTKSKCLDISHLAKSLTKSYEEDPKRGYAKGAIALFETLRFYRQNKQLNERCFDPALKLFDGTGSFGNGSGMRIAPIALYTLNMSEEEMIVSVILATKLTHTHYLAVVGGLLQCFAIQVAINSCFEEYNKNKTEFLDSFFNKVLSFAEKVEQDLNKIEEKVMQNQIKSVCSNMDVYMNYLASHEQRYDADKNSYSARLGVLKKLVDECRAGRNFSLKEFHSNYAMCDVTALESIPVALFAFLIAMDPNCEQEVNSKLKTHDSFQKYNAFERVILYAISLGGDTDTIASMAGAIVGAFIPNDCSTFWSKMCEDQKYVVCLSHALFDLVK